MEGKQDDGSNESMSYKEDFHDIRASNASWMII